MALPLYSTRFLTKQAFNGLFTSSPVPDGQLWILRDLDAYGRVDLFTTGQLFLRGNAGQTIFWADWPQEAQHWSGWRGRQVLFAGDTFGVEVNGTLNADVTISGYVLTAP